MRDILPSINERASSVSRTVVVLAMLATAVAAWLSQATLAFTGTGNARVAVFPLSIVSLLIVAGAAAVVWVAWRVGASLVPLCLLVLIALPWLSPSAPPAFLIWSGPMVLAVWTAIGVSMVVSVRPAGTLVRLKADTARVASGFSRSRSDLAAGAIALVLYSIAAWQVSPSIPGGDEPHYLIITQSLLEDHDLKIENNHKQGDYRAYFAGELPKPDYRRRGRNGEIYSIHAPGLPALIAPAFALAGYHGVVVFLILVASAGSALAWRLARRVTGREDAAWFGWAAVTLTTSEIFHSFTVYPDGVGGVLVLTGVWALLRAQQEAESGSEQTGPWWLHGAALAALPWIHTRFALLAGGLGALILLRLSTTKNAAGKAVAFLLVPAASALAWVGFFIAIYGTPDPAAPYANEEGAASFIPGGLAGLFFDQRFGVLVYEPVLICAIAGLVVMLRDRALRRLGLELLFVVIPYLLAVTHFAMWWGGTSAPGRFFVPVLLVLAIPCAVGWTAIRHRATRVTVWAALAYTAFVSCALVFVGGGRLAYNIRQAYALLLEWLNGATDLALGAPSWWKGQEITRLMLVRDAGIWVSAFVAAWLVLRVIESRGWIRPRGALSAAAGWAFAIAVMVSLSVVWTLAAAQPINSAPAQLDLLRRLGSESRLLALSLPDLERVPLDLLPSKLRIHLRPSDAPGGAGPNDRPLYQVPRVPAGLYRLRPQIAAGAGWLMIGIGRDQFSLISEPLTQVPRILRFPVDVRAIVVRGDEQSRRMLRELTVEPVSILPPSQRLTSDYARHAVLYPTAAVFFLDERSFPEPDAFWVGGARQSTFAVQATAPFPPPPITLRVRNAPVDNHVVMQSGAWRAEMQLAAGEERQVVVPATNPPGTALVTITTSAGFRPSAVDPKSRDDRFLGVWLRVE